MKIDITEALKLVLENTSQISEFENVSLFKAHSRVLAQDIVADIDQPPFDKSAMDGYACKMEDLPASLTLKNLISAGADCNDVVNNGECIQILTGAKVPTGADCVVMQEYTSINAIGEIEINEKQLKSNICYKGEDVKAGQTLAKSGKRLTSADLPVLASAGITQPLVFKKPKVAIICTGSEIQDAGTVPENSKIRNTNVYQLWAQTEQCGAEPAYEGIIPDEKAALVDACKKALEKNDMLITTGGASVGKFDLIPEIFKELGAEIHFSGVAMQPGSPVIFATLGKKALWGLSGNPVSSYLQFLLLTKVSLSILSGEIYSNSRIVHRLAEPLVRHKKNRDLFVPVCLNNDGEIYPVKFNGSAHIAAISGIYGFACLPADKLRIEKGELVDCKTL